MKNWKLIPFFACLTLFLSVTAFAGDTVSVTLTAPDGTPSERAVSCPDGASLWYASYGDSGKALEMGRAPVQDGKAAIALSQDAATVKAFALDDDCKPLSTAFLKGGSPYQRGQELLAVGDYAGAIAAFTDAIKANTDASLSYVGRGDAYIGLGEIAENLAAAQADYEAALALDNTLSEAYLGVADVYIRRADYEQANSVLRDALSKAADKTAIEAKIQEIESGNIQDSSGNIRRESTYDTNGILLWWFEYAYNPQGQQSSVTSYNQDGVETGHIDFRYRDDGKRLTDYNSDIDTGEMFRIEYEYNTVGKVIKEASYSLEGELLDYFLEYDERGNVAKESYYYGDESELGYYYIYAYNESGLWSRRDIYNASGVRTAYQTMLWTGDGQWSVFCRYEIGIGQDVLAWRWVYDYDETGKRIRWTEYDGEGNVTRVTQSD